MPSSTIAQLQANLNQTWYNRRTENVSRCFGFGFNSFEGDWLRQPNLAL